MASIAFPELAKTADLSDGTTYGYVAVPPSDASKPTFLFLHGYPSSSYDWRHQIKSLPASGFGVIVPDLLGFGDTDAPEDVAAYRMKTMAHHMEELLSLEEVSRCIAVGHDWGSGLLSRLITYMPEKLSGAIFISVGYLEPGLVWDIGCVTAFSAEAFIKVSRETFGYETYGYWLWHNTDQAAKDCNDHPASVFSLLYPADPDDWKKYFAPVEKAAAFVRAGRLGPLPTWFDLTEYTIRDRILAKKGYQGPLNWYKAAMRGVNIPDESVLPDEARYCGVPTLFVAASQDFVTRADAQGANTRKWARDLRVKELDCGHWVQLEKPEELHSSLVEFAQQIAA